MQRTVHAPLQVCYLFIFIFLKSDSSHLFFSLFHATACFLVRFSSLSKDVILVHFFSPPRPKLLRLRRFVSSKFCLSECIVMSLRAPCVWPVSRSQVPLQLGLSGSSGGKSAENYLKWRKNANIFNATDAFRCTSHQFGTSSKFSFSSKSPKLDLCIIVMPVPSRDTQSRLISGTRACCGSPMTVWKIMGRWLCCYPSLQKKKKKGGALIPLFTLNLCPPFSLEQQCSSRLRHSAGQSIFD